jgi:hypothetical protein
MGVGVLSGYGMRAYGRGDLGKRERCWEEFSLRARGVVESRLLLPAELQHGLIVAVAHQVSRDRRHRRKVTNKALLSTGMYICVDRSQTTRRKGTAVHAEVW